MRTNRGLSMLVALAVAGLCAAGAKLTANAQNGQDTKKSAPGDAARSKSDVGDANGQDGAQAKKPDTAEQKKLRAELDDLVKKRADLDRRIAETRGKLGETGRSHQRIELRTGDGPPQVFEFDGDGTGVLPPEARKQLEEAQKHMQDVLGSLKFDDLPKFDFQFDGDLTGKSAPDMKAFRDRMQKWQQEFQNRLQRRFNFDGDNAPIPDGKKAKPDKSEQKRLKTLDA
jgi:hypothetical protein